MAMPGRKYEQITGVYYRYSINGQEIEKEINQNVTSAEFWIFDSRVVKRWNADPLLKVSESPYLVFGGNPIRNVDIFGSDTSIYNESGKKIATFGSSKQNVNYVIRTTKTSTQLETDGLTKSKPITSAEANEVETILSETALWSEGDPGLMKQTMYHYRKYLVQIKTSEQMIAARNEVSKDDGTGGTKPDNNRERGGVFTPKGIRALPPGAVSNPANGVSASIRNPNGDIDFHSHPSGYRKIVLPGGGGATASWRQPPSVPDVTTTGKRTEYVFGMATGLIYVYDKNGVKATLPINTDFYIKK